MNTACRSGSKSIFLCNIKLSLYSPLKKLTKSNKEVDSDPNSPFFDSSNVSDFEESCNFYDEVDVPSLGQ